MRDERTAWGVDISAGSQKEQLVLADVVIAVAGDDEFTDPPPTGGVVIGG